MIVTQNKQPNRELTRRGVPLLYETESVDHEHHSRPRLYWLEDAEQVQSTSRDQAWAHLMQSHSTVEVGGAKDDPFTGFILCCALSDSVDPLFYVGEGNVRSSSSGFEKLPILSHLGSYRNAVTIRTPDSNAVAVTRQMAEPVYPPCEGAEVAADATLSSVGLQSTEGVRGKYPSMNSLYSTFSIPTDLSPDAGAAFLSRQSEAFELSTVEGSLQDEPTQLGGSSLFITRRMSTVAAGYPSGEAASDVQAALHPVVEAFTKGHAGIRPKGSTLEAAIKIVEAANEKVSAKEIEVDNRDGSLSFELRLTSGLLVIGELSLDGIIRANIYNDQHPNISAGLEEIWVKHLPRVSAADLIAQF